MSIIPSIGRNVSDLLNYFGGASTYQAPAQAAPVTYNVRGVPMTDADLHTLAATMFGEVSNRDQAKQELEARTIANTALNRVAQYRAQGGKYANYGLSDVITQPNQYQAYNGNEYKRYLAGSTTPVDSQKIGAINSVVTQMKSGQFPDTTGGRVYYAHDPSGKIWLKDGSLFNAQPSASRTLDDLNQ